MKWENERVEIILNKFTFHYVAWRMDDNRAMYDYALPCEAKVERNSVGAAEPNRMQTIIMSSYI